MKIRIVSALMAVAVPACMTNCATTETTRTLPDGSVERRTEKGLSDRAAGVAMGVAVLAGDIARARAGAPQAEPNPSK
jgi:hypothetical protein